jgi:hypothetical protein
MLILTNVESMGDLSAESMILKILRKKKRLELNRDV